jgi:hypothetical protein
MKLHTLLLLLVLAAIAAFATLNWSVFITPTALSLGYADVEMPLGLVMLGLLVFLTAIFLIFVVYLQGSALFETRRQTRELLANRELADKAEASRFTELRTFLEAELSRHASLNADAKSEIVARVDQLEQKLHSVIDESGNTLAAYIGELEDRLDNAGKPSAE